jgi:hypothetical protein
MSEKSESKTTKPKISPEEKRKRLIAQVSKLARKLKNTSPTHREAAYWEQIEEDLSKALSGPLD